MSGREKKEVGNYPVAVSQTLIDLSLEEETIWSPEGINLTQLTL